MSQSADKTPSMLARYTTASIMTGFLSLWANFAYPARDATPGLTAPMHTYHVPLFLTVFYLVSLPTLRFITERFLAPKYDMKLLLTESMLIYNVAQVALNGWMVYAMIDAVANRGHPFIGDRTVIETGAAYAVWVHYCDKYLEFFDTYFMILRGNMKQVSFLHIYHHTTIAWAWWIAICFAPGGDSYFGALLNSIIHVMMYSYYALALLKVPCPWKRFLTQAQLAQFTSVVIYTGCTGYYHYKFTDHNLTPTIGTYLFCCGVQVFEMVSLFILFSIFYKKSYSKKNKKSNDDSDDQCNKAVGAITDATKEVVGTAAKDATKFMATASKALNTAKNAENRLGTM
mmetsp:Transcript_13074/g.27481  ORF Transcript_13074/g.27481 Transcript_13074/m.27481 type:complete len:343 (+) Transcript_13074:194-1222(+)